MRLNTEAYKEAIRKKGITDESVRLAVGFSARTYDWIMRKQYIEVETLERIADVIGVEVAEIILDDPYDVQENVIEFLKGSKTATVTFSQGRCVTRIQKLAERYPDQCQIMRLNKDGSIYAHVPVEWVKILPVAQRSETQREAARRNVLKTRSHTGNKG